MAITVAEALENIRVELREATAAFWTDEELLEFLDDGMTKQHRIVLDAAKKTGRFRDFAHPYLAKYIGTATGTTTSDASDTSLESDYYEPVYVAFGSPLIEGYWVTPEDEWKTRAFPQYGPTFWRICYSIVPTADATRKLRLYGPGLGNVVPHQALPYEIVYYRDITVTAGSGSGNLDVDPPYHEGPMAWAIGRAYQKQNTDATPWFQRFHDAATRIIPVPEAPKAAQ